MRGNGVRRLIESFPKDASFADAFECLFEDASDAIYILDAHGNFVAVNREAEELTGFKREDWIGKSFRKIIPVRSLPKATEGFMNVIRGKPIRVELELKTAFKKTVLVEVTAKPLIIKGRIVGTLGIARDITERKKAEQALKESEEKFRNLAEQSPNMIFINKKGRVVYANKKCEEIMGYKREEFHSPDFDFFVLIAPESMDLLKSNLNKHMKGEEIAPYEYTFITKEGNKIEVILTTRLIMYEGMSAILGIITDITERKLAEEKLRLFSQSVDSSVDGVAMGNLEGKITYVNEAFVRMFGYSRKELIGKEIPFIYPEDQIPKLEEALKATMEGGWTGELVGKRKNGGLFPMAISSSRVVDDEGKIIAQMAIHRDITERKQMEKKLQEYSEHLEELVEKRTRQLKETQEQLLKSERLVAIGEMAAMVGHDLRNPLTGIAGVAYYLKTKLSPRMDKKIVEMLELIEKDIEYSNKIISDLLAYSGDVLLEPAVTTPESIIKDVLALVRIPENIRVLDLTDNKPKMKVDIQKTKRVFVNITENAIDAMPKGGTLTITSKESNGNLEIAFSDTGVGMPEEVVEKIWTPLFTTKAKGMGLGLPICKRIVEAHRGDVSVESTVGKGTTFTVTIPIKPKLEGGEKVWVNVPESSLLTTTKA